jgi:nicotinate-nucleotide pyrophosphorylase
MSGIATLTHRHVQAVVGTRGENLIRADRTGPARIDKLAVKLGGGSNHVSACMIWC